MLQFVIGICEYRDQFPSLLDSAVGGIGAAGRDSAVGGIGAAGRDSAVEWIATGYADPSYGNVYMVSFGS